MADDYIDVRFLSVAIPVILRVMRRRNMLKPADLTDLRVALQNGARGDMYHRLSRILDETVMDREEKRETPKKHG